MQMGMEMTKHQLESKAIQERDKAEIREVLQIIVNNQDDMRTLLNMQSSRDSQPVEEMMESLQTVSILRFLPCPRSGRLKKSCSCQELMDPQLHPIEEEVFKAGLWMLHEETAKLPPLTDRESLRTLLVGA